MQICLAGHYPPVIATPGQPGALAEIPPSLLIGAAPDANRRTTSVTVSPGMLICFYTDGLVERRREPIEDRLALLCQSVRAVPPEVACARIMTELVGAEQPRDDIALVALRRKPTDREP
jgi:sigma-B regulation protein RsbU (phosphoserine phosphatase)